MSHNKMTRALTSSSPSPAAAICEWLMRLPALRTVGKPRHICDFACGVAGVVMNSRQRADSVYVRLSMHTRCVRCVQVPREDGKVQVKQWIQRVRGVRVVRSLV